jgi:hypothetical protein
LVARALRVALADQVALDFRRHTQYHRHDLGLEAAVDFQLPLAA